MAHADRGDPWSRVFATGSVVQVGRWPHSMLTVYEKFLAYMTTVRPFVMDAFARYQRTLYDCGWTAKERPDKEGNHKRPRHSCHDTPGPEDHPEDRPVSGPSVVVPVAVEAGDLGSHAPCARKVASSMPWAR